MSFAARMRLAAAVTLVAGGAAAAELEVTVGNVANDRGHVLVALCTPETFLQPACPYSTAADAVAGTTRLTLRDVLPGRYAVQAFHDENGNRRIDRNFLGLPVEGLGFGNDAEMRLGPPDFAESAVIVGRDVAATSLRLRYLSER